MVNRVCHLCRGDHLVLTCHYMETVWLSCTLLLFCVRSSDLTLTQVIIACPAITHLLLFLLTHKEGLRDAVRSHSFLGASRLLMVVLWNIVWSVMRGGAAFLKIIILKPSNQSDLGTLRDQVGSLLLGGCSGWLCLLWLEDELMSLLDLIVEVSLIREKALEIHNLLI